MPTFKETAICVASGVDFDPVHGNPFEQKGDVKLGMPKNAMYFHGEAYGIHVPCHIPDDGLQGLGLMSQLLGILNITSPKQPHLLEMNYSLFSWVM